MTATAWTIDYLCGGLFQALHPTPTPAFGKEARLLIEREQRVAQESTYSFLPQGPIHQFIQDVEDIVINCRDEGWDGYDATPVSVPVLLRAIQFIRSYSDELPIPEITPEPDGEVSLDWLGREGQSLSVSIGEGDKIAYAHVLKNNSLYGVMSFAEPDINLFKSLIRSVIARPRPGH